MKEKYYPIFEKSIQNKAKEEAILSFEDFGVKTKWIDITKKGITIRQFNKMITKVYEKGYADGLEKSRELNQADKEGKTFQRFSKIARHFKETNQINK